MPINSPYVLVVGGAGYIGSHMLVSLRRAGYIPIVLDNLSKGHRDAVGNETLIVGDMGDADLLKKLFSQYSFVAVMHFAALIEVAESIQFPMQYYQNNIAATLVLLNAMITHQVKHFIFSSTAAVYGEPQSEYICESHIVAPMNPYGRSKWMMEEIIKDVAHSYDLHFSILRYFNAAGADVKNQLSERHEPESHLIPLVLQVAAGLRNHITIYGNQYPTFDGTCIRDYVHVIDLCQAHLLALNKLMKDKKNHIYNLGTGQGHSVLQVIEIAKKITKRNISVKLGEAREGDPAVLVADGSLAKQELQWIPQYSDLNTIILHAWQAFQVQAIFTETIS